MQVIIDYFTTIPSLHRALILAGGIAFFWMLESIKPMFDFSYNKWNHAAINIFFTCTTILVNFILAFVLLMAADWSTENEIGILHILRKMPMWLFAFIGLLLLDLFGAYLPHLTQHKIKFLWRYHLIHHTDTWIDTTSANRHHPGESFIRFIFTAFGVFIVGSPIWLVFLYQSLSIVFSQFNHANIAIPRKMDKILSYFLVSPDMHKIHHHYVLPYTDSNYGNIFSIWDHLFKTFSYLEREKIVYGIDTHVNDFEHNNLKYLLKIPLNKPKKTEK